MNKTNTINRIKREIKLDLRFVKHKFDTLLKILTHNKR